MCYTEDMTTTTPALTAEQKIAIIETSEMSIAWDGCHKVYFLQDDKREAEAREYGYDIYPPSFLREAIAGSCGLVFVSRWGFDNADFEDPLNIDQFDEELIRIFWPEAITDADEEETS